MKKVLVISDTHGDKELIKEVQQKEKPDVTLHLGDFARDLEGGYAVKGNCDAFSKEPLERILDIEGLKILMVHGHVEGVKGSLEGLFYKAKVKEVDIALFGHTHRPFGAEVEDIFIFNPGSLRFPAPEEVKSYLVLEIKEGEFVPRFEQVE